MPRPSRAPRRADADGVITAVAALPGGRLRLVGIDGPGGAGKTTLAEQVAAAVPGVRVVHVDDFGGPDARGEWDWTRFRRQVLLPLLAGDDARYQRWSWDADAGTDWVAVPARSLLLVEGVSATRREVGAQWDLTVWVETAAPVRRQRAVHRDGPARWPVWEQQWIPTEQAYIARERPQSRVDLVVRGDAGDAPDVRNLGQ